MIYKLEFIETNIAMSTKNDYYNNKSNKHKKTKIPWKSSGWGEPKSVDQMYCGQTGTW